MKQEQVKAALVAIKGKGNFKITGISKNFKPNLYAKNYKLECLTCGEVSVRTFKWITSDVKCRCSKLLANKEVKKASSQDVREARQLLKGRPYKLIGTRTPFSWSPTARVFEVECTFCGKTKNITKIGLTSNSLCMCQHAKKMRGARDSAINPSRILNKGIEALKEKEDFTYLNLTEGPPYLHKIQCNKCNVVSERTLSWIRSPYGCPCTRVAKIIASSIETKERYSEKWNLETRKLRIVSKFKGYHHKVKVLCLSCNHKWRASATNLRRAGCPKCAPALSKKRHLAKYGVEHPSQREETKSKIRKTMKDRYGVSHALQSRRILNKMLDSSYLTKPYMLGTNVVNVQGYEHYALDWILGNTRIPPSDILCGGDLRIPTVDYIGKNKKPRKYLPDFYIPSKNLIVEVKSEYTYLRGLEINLMKKEACKRLGYRFIFMVMGRKGERLDVKSIRGKR